MTVTSVAAARAIWLFDVIDLNPHGRYIYDQLFPWLVERYRFAKAPAHSRDQDQNAWAFMDGRFVTSDGPIDATLKVYNDGVVGETHSSTSDSEAFLADVVTSAVQELAVTFTGSMVHRKLYVSELNLTCEKNLDAINPMVNAFTQALSEAYCMKLELTSLGFGGDPATQPIFRLERKVNIPFSQHKYWSIANLSTSAHVALLEQLEALLGA